VTRAVALDTLAHAGHLEELPSRRLHDNPVPLLEILREFDIPLLAFPIGILDVILEPGSSLVQDFRSRSREILSHSRSVCRGPSRSETNFSEFLIPHGFVEIGIVVAVLFPVIQFIESHRIPPVLWFLILEYHGKERIGPIFFAK
jgi:hypothetical protein